MLSGLLTLLFLLLFLGGSLWIWQPKLNASMQTLAAIPLEDEPGASEQLR